MMERIDVIAELRRRGGSSLIDRKRAVDACGVDLDACEAWLRDLDQRRLHPRTAPVTLAEVESGRSPQARAYDPGEAGDA